MVDKDVLLDKLTNEDVIEIIKSLGGDYYKNNELNENSPSIIFPTVCHHGSSNKLYYYPDNKVFHCYTQCGETFNIYGLVMRSLEVNFYEALVYIVNTLGYHSLRTKVGFADIDNKIEDWDILNKYTSYLKEREIPVLPTYRNSIVDIFSNLYYNGWIKEGITVETMKKYNIKYSVEKERIVIPHYNINGELVGIRGRSLNKKDIDSGYKYMPLEIESELYNHQTALNLYGLDKTKDAIQRVKKVMLVEAEKSVMQCDSFYGESNFTVAVSGSNVSNFQRDLILSLNPSEVIIGFDKEWEDDESMERFFAKILRIAYKFVNYCTVYILYDKNNITEYKSSPTDYGREVLETLMKDKFEIKRGEE